MSTIFNVFKRDDTASPVSKTTIGLLIALLVLIIIACSTLAGFIIVRRRRARRDLGLPLYHEKRLSTASSSSTHRRIMVRPSESVLVYQEKKALLESSTSPPNSPLPEIRITFPEEFDASGKRTSGRVVVVKVGDTSVGLEPLDEKLPLYEREEGGRFHSVDLERIGGLTEKDIDKQWR